MKNLKKSESFRVVLVVPFFTPKNPIPTALFRLICQGFSEAAKPRCIVAVISFSRAVPY